MRITRCINTSTMQQPQVTSVTSITNTNTTITGRKMTVSMEKAMPEVMATN